MKGINDVKKTKNKICIFSDFVFDYKSTITVTNSGNAIAKDVVISDRVARGPEPLNNTNLEFVTANRSGGETGSYNPGTHNVSFSAVDLNPGESSTINVTTRVQDDAPTGQYCNEANFTSSNSISKFVTQCIHVPEIVALQTQMTDDKDPVMGDGSEDLQMTSILINEERSNEGVKENVVQFKFGYLKSDPLETCTFRSILSRAVEVYYFENITSDFNFEQNKQNATKLVSGRDYIVSDVSPGQQTITITDDFVVYRMSALFFTHWLDVSNADNEQYQSAFDWSSVGASSGRSWNGSSTEPTTVIK